jgi:shikimate kinase
VAVRDKSGTVILPEMKPEHTENFRIILITGPKHTGKSSAGYIASQLMKGVFIDLDELVEHQTGRSPRTLYREGPHIFRKAEAAALKSLFDTPENVQASCQPNGGARDSLHDVKNKEPLIVAAGGGLIDNEDAMALLKNSVDVNTRPIIYNKAEIFIVYLDVSADTAWNRIMRSARQSGELPAFLQTADPMTTHRSLHIRRSQTYREIAHFIIHGENKSAERIAREIADLDIFHIQADPYP